MRLTMHEDGSVQMDLEPDDQQITINIGQASVWGCGGTLAEPGTGPQARGGRASLQVLCSPRDESEEPYEP